MYFLDSLDKKSILMVLILGMGVLMLPLHALAEPDILKDFSFDDCDPFETRAIIMTVNGQKAQLVAGEQIIYVVDLNLGDQHLITELTDRAGNRLDISAFRRGQWVYVKGFRHIDGGVVASLVQRIDPPESQKPVLRKISQDSRQYRRTGGVASDTKN